MNKSDVLLLPTFVSYLDFDTLITLPYVCKSASMTVKDSPETIDFWVNVCRSFCLKKGLYNYVDESFQKKAKSIFFCEIWPSRNKWMISEVAEQQPFQVKVVCRFRPGEMKNDSMLLPLHQFLKLQRKKQQLQSDEAKDGRESYMLGEMDPPEYVDSFLNVLFNEPVKLLTSNRMVERSVAMQCIHRTGRDPFNNKLLTHHHIVPQPELQHEIEIYKQEKLKKRECEVQLSAADMRPLIEENSLVDPELLKAIVDMERLNQIVSQSERDALRDNSTAASIKNRKVGINVTNSHVSELQETDNNDDGNMDDHDENVSANVPQTNAVNASQFLSMQSDGSRDENNFTTKQFGKNATVVYMSEEKCVVNMHVNGVGIKAFHFTNVFNAATTQLSIYNNSLRDSVTACLNGYNTALMCYGQTGAGKTHTFFGPDGSFESLSQNLSASAATSVERFDIERFSVPHDAGMAIRAVVEALKSKKKFESHLNIAMTVSIQFIEIYDEKVLDLIANTYLTVRRADGELVGVSESEVEDVRQAIDVIVTGHERKKFAATSMNERSSRSHTALILKFTQQRKCQQLPGAKKSAAADDVLVSKLFLLDLAGSERVKKSQLIHGAHAHTQQFRETVQINSSLLSLGRVIAAIVESKSHVPYLESKLTTLLKQAFGGNCRTTVVVNCHSDDRHGDETLQSLRFGERCSMISNQAKLVSLSLVDSLQLLSRSLKTCLSQLSSLEARGKTHLTSYKKLRGSYNLLLMQHKQLEEKLV